MITGKRTYATEIFANAGRALAGAGAPAGRCFAILSGKTRTAGRLPGGDVRPTQGVREPAVDDHSGNLAMSAHPSLMN